MANDTYKLEYHNNNLTRNIISEFDVDRDMTWYEVLRNFTDFLGHVYGYDITTEVMKGINAE